MVDEAFAVLELTETIPENLKVVAIYRTEVDADSYISENVTQDLVKRDVILTNKQFIELEIVAQFHLPMNF